MRVQSIRNIGNKEEVYPVTFNLRVSSALLEKEDERTSNWVVGLLNIVCSIRYCCVLEGIWTTVCLKCNIQ